MDRFTEIAGKASDGKNIYYSSTEILSALNNYYQKIGRNDQIDNLSKYYDTINTAIGINFN